MLVINELTNNTQEGNRTDRTNIDAFVENYLSVPQRDDLEGTDYVLPSSDLSLRASSIVWPSEHTNKQGLGDNVSTASDHRLVWADIDV